MKLFKEIEKTLPYIESVFSNEQLALLRESHYKDLSLFHFGLGTWIRNTLLDEHSSLYQTFLQYHITDKDDMSALVVSYLYLSLTERSLSDNFSVK